MIKVTSKGKEKIQRYIDELKEKRKEILDAGIDTAEETELPTYEDIVSDIELIGLDEDGEYFNNWGVTDKHNGDYPISLKKGEDFQVVEQIYHVTASNEEVCLLVCYAKTREKAVQLTKDWIKEMGGSEEVDGVYAFRIFTVDMDRIGFDDDLIMSDPRELSYEELGIAAENGEPASYYE